MKKFCLYCGKELDLTNRDKRSKFCNSSCAAKYNNSKRKHSEETKKKISKALTKNNNGRVAELVDALRSNRSGLNTRESSNLSTATKRKRYTIEDVKREIVNSKSYSQLCRKLGIGERGGNIKTIKSIIFNNDLDVSHFTRNINYDKLIVECVPNSKSYAEVCRKIGVKDYGSSCTKIAKRIKELGLDTTHFTGKLWSKGNTSVDDDRIYSKDVNQFLSKESYIQSNKLKKMLFKYSLKEEKCEKCLNSEWMGEKIPLQLHHINGDCRDNRIENLMILCPNCHAQTDNYCSKNKINKII